MGQNRFERDTAVATVDEGRYRGRVDPGWAVIAGAAPNGGYLLAMAARAMRDPVPHPDPVTITAHFLAPPQPGEIDIEVEVVRTGRRHSTVQGRMVQDGRETLRAIATFGDLDSAAGPTRVDRARPPLPRFEDCIDATTAGVEEARAGGFQAPPVLERFDHRMTPEMMRWSRGEPLGRGEMGGWLRWADDDGPVDTLGVLVVTDCYPPAVFNSGVGNLGWVPTIELTVQVRKRPAPGYLGAWLTTQAITGGYLEEDGEVWDSTGDLVALSRQLALASR
ncbi:MAG TPA: thioesterase family protein [Egicoccus sp.]|nr:thioesterase family protein [Egicoccus sp.]HSK22163.1 thioesterase family protein [Egicoccus sp.]